MVFKPAGITTGKWLAPGLAIFRPEALDYDLAIKPDPTNASAAISPLSPIADFDALMYQNPLETSLSFADYHLPIVSRAPARGTVEQWRARVLYSRAMRLPPTPSVPAQGPPAFETMAFKRLEDFLPGRDLFVILCRESPPTDSDWNHYMEAAQASVAKQPEDLTGVMTLVLSDGGVPDAMQRTRITGLQERTSSGAPLSLISDSPLIRGATRAMALFNPQFRVFTPGSFAKALDHLGVPPARATIVKSHILETEKLLGGQRIRVVRAIFARSGAE